LSFRNLVDDEQRVDVQTITGGDRITLRVAVSPDDAGQSDREDGEDRALNPRHHLRRSHEGALLRKLDIAHDKSER
jgi:hypothetical protein